MTIITYNPNKISGVIYLNDGTKVLWAEGFSNSTIVYPDGIEEIVSSQDENNLIIMQINQLAKNGFDQSRESTPEEINQSR